MRINYGGGNAIGGSKYPIYLNSDGEPRVCDNVLNVGVAGGLFNELGEAINSFNRPEDEGKRPVYFKKGKPVECEPLLPLSAGADYKINGPLGLTEGVNYGDTFPPTGDEFIGQIFFMEDNNDLYYLPKGGIQNEILIKNSNEDGDAKWASLDHKFVPNGGTEGQVLMKRSYIDGDTEWTSLDHKFIPSGGVKGQILIKDSSEDGNASWMSLDNKFLPSGGSTGQVLVKNSSTDGDASWTTLSNSYLPLSGGTLTGNLTLQGALKGTYYVTTNYGTADPTSSTPGAGVNGALYFKIIS